MIPILYDYNEQAFMSNGLGRLSDCISCIVTEERNGRYDLEFTYPVGGLHFSEILEGRIIAVTHDEEGDVQPFVIYSSSKPIDGIVTFNAYHLSYRLGGYPTTYSSDIAVTCQTILTNLAAFASLNGETWTFTTDITGSASKYGYDNDTEWPPCSVREHLGGRDGSVLDLFKGEYEFDKWAVNLWKNRGANNGVTIRYGKNLSDFKAETDYSGACSHIVAIYTGDYIALGAKLHGSLFNYYDTGHRLPGNRISYGFVDFSDKIENGETKDFTTINTELGALAAQYATANKPWNPAVSIEVDFVQLWQTEEYKDYAPLLTCKLCDSVNVSFPFYDIADLAVKIVAVEWDALNDRYTKMTLGGLATTLAQSVNANLSGSIQAQADAINTINSRAWVSDVTVNGTSVVTDGVAAVTVPSEPTWEALTLTRTNNNYVNATNFARLAARKYGKLGLLFLNLQMSTTMPNSTALTNIGSISGATIALEADVTVPCQSNNATILVQITTGGDINVGNYSGTATGTNFFRAVIPFVLA